MTGSPLPRSPKHRPSLIAEYPLGKAGDIKRSKTRENITCTHTQARIPNSWESFCTATSPTEGLAPPLLSVINVQKQHGGHVDQICSA